MAVAWGRGGSGEGIILSMENPVPDLARMAAYLAEQPDVVVAYHFGSTAVEDLCEENTQNIAILFSAEAHGGDPGLRQQEITEGLMRSAGLYDLLLVRLDEATHRQAFNIIKEGKLIFQRDKAERIEFEVKTMKLHFDFDYKRRQLSIER